MPKIDEKQQDVDTPRDPNELIYAASAGPVELYAEDGEEKKNSIRGAAMVYGDVYEREDFAGDIVREIFEPGCFNFGSDLRIYRQHNRNELLGRVTAGTATYQDSEKELTITCRLPDTSFGRDVRVQMKRGDVRGLSVGCMYPRKEQWVKVEKGVYERRIKDIDIVEVSVVDEQSFKKSVAELYAAKMVPPDEAEKQAEQLQARALAIRARVTKSRTRLSDVRTHTLKK